MTFIPSLSPSIITLLRATRRARRQAQVLQLTAATLANPAFTGSPEDAVARAEVAVKALDTSTLFKDTL